MNSSYKFLDSYTKDDRIIFFGWNNVIRHFISPLQGLKGIGVPSRIGRCPMLNVFCAYSAKKVINNHIIALKGLNTFKKDAMLFASTIHLQALKGQAYLKAGQCPARKPVYYFLKPCKGEIY